MDRVKKIIETRRVVSSSDRIHLCRHFVLITLLSLVIFSLPVSGGNVIVRNGQLNVSAGIYSDSDTFYIDSENDRVGIGTSSPAGRLDVNGSLGHFYIDSGGSSAIFTRNSWNYITTSGASSNLAVKTGGSDWGNVRVVILSDGKVGVGTTTPSAKLEVNGSLRVDNSTGSAVLYVNASNGNVGIGTGTPETKLDIAGTETEYKTIQFTDTTSNEKWQWSHRIGGQNNRFDMYYYNGSTWSPAYISVSTGGNIGMGTTGAATLLEIKGSDPDLTIRSSNQGEDMAVGFSAAASWVKTAIVADDLTSWGKTDLHFVLDNTADSTNYTIGTDTRMIIKNAGYVGIGTILPVAPLHVQGGASNNLNTLAVFGQSNNTVMQMRFQQVSNGDGWGYYKFGMLGPGTTMDESGGITYDGNDPNYDFLTGIIFSSIDGSTYFVNKKATYSGASRALSDVALLTLEGDDNCVGIGTMNPEDNLEVYESGDAPYIGLNRDGNKIWGISINSAGNLAFQSGGTWTALRASTPKLWIENSTGNVGIGTASPLGKLDISGSIAQPLNSGIWYNLYYDSGWKYRANGYGGVIKLENDGDLIYQSASNNSAGAGAAATVSTKLSLENDGTLYLSGDVGIGTASPNDALDVIGDIDATGCVQTDDAGSIGGTCVSDVRFKTNIQSLEGSLDRISRLNPVSFEWDPEYYAISSEGGTGVGLIAQELEEVYPELVVTGEDGYKRVRYDIELEMHLIQAVKELKVENEELKAEKDAEILALKQAVCELDPGAVFCTDL